MKTSTELLMLWSILYFFLASAAILLNSLLEMLKDFCSYGLPYKEEDITIWCLKVSLLQLNNFAVNLKLFILKHLGDSCWEFKILHKLCKANNGGILSFGYTWHYILSFGVEGIGV